MTQSSELMPNSNSPEAQLDYKQLLVELIALDRQYKDKVDLNTVVPHFLHLQSLIRCSVEHCEGAIAEVDAGRTLSGMALTRIAFDHVILASYLFQSTEGPDASKWILQKNNRELARDAVRAGATENGKNLLDFAERESIDIDGVKTKTSKIIKLFQEREALELLYSLLSQAVHPNAAPSFYIGLAEETGERQIRRTSLYRDSHSVEPFIFQILAVAVLLDADLRSDSNIRTQVLGLVGSNKVIPELTL